uniref:RPAC1 protein n=1 Tax=Gongylonema pulchrum TaxID=637853 RepID=A0A183DLE6_9BILA
LQDAQFSYDRLPELLPTIGLGIPCPEQLDDHVHGKEVPDSERDDDGIVKKKKRKLDETCIAPLHGTPVYEFINGTVKCNEKLASLTDIARPLLRDAVEAVNKVKNHYLIRSK